jgi:hypothetical protein
LRRSSSATRALEDSFGGEAVVVAWPDAVSLAQQRRDLPRRLPVGSSARSSEGRFTSAIATRCCCPPESWSGRCRSWPASPTRHAGADGGPAPARDALPDHRLLTLEDTVAFFDLVLGARLAPEEKADLAAYLRAL